MSSEINRDRRRFLGASAMTLPPPSSVRPVVQRHSPPKLSRYPLKASCLARAQLSGSIRSR